MFNRRIEPVFGKGAKENDENLGGASVTSRITAKLAEANSLCDPSLRQTTKRDYRTHPMTVTESLKRVGIALSVLVAGIGILFVFLPVSPTRPVPRTSDTKTSAEAPDQFRCADYYYGSLPGLQEVVKGRLRDPASFEHIRSRFTSVRPDGTQEIVMEYRARNGFGGYNIERAVALFSNSTCAIITWK